MMGVSMISSYIIIILVIILAIPISSVLASGPRLDSGDDVTEEEHDCYVDGYDAGFAGKYDSDRASECYENGDDEYNESWANACDNAPRTEEECIDIMNNPVEIEDHEALQQENAKNCWNDGYEDSNADKPYNKDRAKDVLNTVLIIEVDSIQAVRLTLQKLVVDY